MECKPSRQRRLGLHRKQTEPPTEIEVKFRAADVDSKRILACELLASGTPPKKQKLKAINFDTAADDLARKGISLRVRKAGRSGAVLCVKAPGMAGEAFARRESEVKVPDFEPRYEMLDDATAGEIKRHIGESRLEPRFETHVDRWKRTLPYGRSVLDVSLDRGEIMPVTCVYRLPRSK